MAAVLNRTFCAKVLQSEEPARHFNRNVYELKQITFLMQYTEIEYIFNYRQY